MIYILRSHVCNVVFMKQWYVFKAELPPNKTYILFDNTKSAMDDDFYEENKEWIILIDHIACIQSNKYHVSMLNNVDTSLSLCYTALQSKGVSFSYLWLIENDVYCNGNWASTLAKQDVQSDFIATFVEDYSVPSRNWMHWHNIVGELSCVPLTERVKSFFPVTVYSHTFLQVIHANISKSSGFCEVYLPTLAKHNNLKYEKINDNVIGNFRCECVQIPTLKNDTLFHKHIYV